MPVVYGLHPVREALAGGQVERLLIQRDSANPRLNELVGLARARGVDVRFEPRPRLDQLAERNLHQGVVAFIAGRAMQTLEELVASAPANPLYLILDGIEDPHNLGAILRCADGAGVAGIVLPKRRSAPLSETVWKVSAGAAQYVPIARVPNIVQAMETLKAHGVWVVGTDVQAPRLWDEADFTTPLAVVVGREGEGLHQLVKSRCDFLVRLPMLGKVQSLNVSVSTGILLYEALRQRRKAGVV